MLLCVPRLKKVFHHQVNCFEKNHTSTIITNPYKKTQKNTLISFQWIRTFPHQYQHFLERLSDFLLDGENWWSETNEGVDFADVTPVQPSKTNTLVQQFHFRSNTVKTVQTYI